MKDHANEFLIKNFPWVKYNLSYSKIVSVPCKAILFCPLIQVVKTCKVVVGCQEQIQDQKPFFLLHNLSSSGDIINPCHCQKAAVSTNIISPATVKYQLVSCINCAVNHGKTAMLFYNRAVNNLCLDHKSVPATAPINNSNFETERIFLFACKTVLVILVLASV